jgi:hypothetical protein
LLLCASTERAALAAPTHGVSPKKDAERRDKRSARSGEIIRLGKLGGIFQNAGDVEKTPLACERKAT